MDGDSEDQQEKRTYDVYRINLPFGFKIGFHWRMMKRGCFKWNSIQSYVYWDFPQPSAIDFRPSKPLLIIHQWRIKLLWFHFGRRQEIRIWEVEYD